jgi:hypothetical protein
VNAVGGGGAPGCAVVGSERNDGERHEVVSPGVSVSARRSDGSVPFRDRSDFERTASNVKRETGTMILPGRAPRVP